MPFVRHTRDKRGHETTIVSHAYRAGPGSGKGRVLYLFHSPSHIRVGRQALDAEVREALEHTHPDLTFDWNALTREMAAARPDPRERDRERERPTRSAARRQSSPSSAPPSAPAPRRDDASLLARVATPEEAARLRGRYAEVVQRIARRAPTPEDRDRLNERLRSLNPDSWATEADIRSGLATAEAEWTSVLNELPSRRRGRRGGRGRGPEGERPGQDARTAEESAIIKGNQEGAADEDGSDGVDSGDRDVDDGRDSDSGGAERAPDE